MELEELYNLIPELTRVEKKAEDDRRGIKSYVLRGQRLKEYQFDALKNHFHDYAIIYDGKKMDFGKIFGNNNPTVIEIGFGMGTSTVRIAASNPNINYIGIEVFLYGFSKLISAIEDRKLKNIKVMRFDAVQVLQDMVEDGSVDGFHIFFPDPWPKERHHKRRLIQVPFASLLASKLKKGGYIYCVTDWQDYADQMLEVFDQVPSLVNNYNGFAPQREWRPETSFERKGLDKDYKINEVWVEKK